MSMSYPEKILSVAVKTWKKANNCDWRPWHFKSNETLITAYPLWKKPNLMQI